MVLDHSLKQLPANSPVLLNNTTCWYCGRSFDEPGFVATKEHTIGRRFVPKGKLDGQWNLIGWACLGCNGHKADLENDLSAISMQPDAIGRFADSDHVLQSEAERKAKRSCSRRTGKLIKDSVETITIKMPLAAGVELKFEATSAPQADSEHVYDLARLQLMAFFYWLTFNRNTRRGGFWRGGFFPVDETVRSDWGNVVMRGFMDSVANWEPRLMGITASGFYKVAIRRHPDAATWSWALEWNKQRRIAGFFGDQIAAQAIAKTFPRLPMESIAEGPNSFLRYHLERPLPEADDKLFYWEPARNS